MFVLEQEREDKWDVILEKIFTNFQSQEKFFHAAEFCLEIKPSEPKHNYEVSCLFDARNEIRHRK